MKEITRNQIKELAEMVLEQTQKLLAYPNGAPQIEVDLTKQNLQKLYVELDALVNDSWRPLEKSISEVVDEQVDELLNAAEEQLGDTQEEIIQQIQEQHEVIEEQNEEQEEHIELDEQHIEPEPAKIEKEEVPVAPQASIKEVKKVVEKTTAKPVVEEAPAPREQAVQEETKEAQPESKPETEPKAEKKTAEEPKKPKADVPSIGDHLQKKPISSLKKAIGINDKFQFINELFDGKMKFYNEAIDRLENAANGEEAKSIFNEIAQERQWDMENPAYEQLLNYVERRYA